VLVCAALAGLFGLATGPSASASAKLTLVDPRGNSVFRQGNSSAVDLARYTTERAAFARSDAVLNEAATALGVARQTVLHKV